MATRVGELEPVWSARERGGLSRGRLALGRFVRRQPMGAVSLLIIALIALGALFAARLHTASPTGFGGDILAHPSGSHFFGTNRQGQDMWSRVLYGARPALEIGLGTVALSVVVGAVLALLAGFLGSLVDMVISRCIEVLICLPAILWALVLSTSADAIPGLKRGSVLTLAIAISIGLAPVIARILRGNVLRERHRQYVEAARVVGASETRIMLRHVLPNIAPLIIVVASATLPAAILAEAGLSFLGVGLPQGDPSWGADLGGQARSLFRTYWWLPVFPGVALSLTVLAFNLLGDSIRDVLDPRLRGSR